MSSRAAKRPKWAPITNPQRSASLPRSLDVTEFAAARSGEIRALTDLLSTFNGNRRTFQTLPRHLRRRTMSHDIRRMPVRLRLQARKEFEKDPNLQVKADQQQLRNRRQKRRNRAAMQKFGSRSAKHQWLSTHLWHAKRMHMQNLWNFRLAVSPHDKGERATHRAMSHLCSAYDATYIAALEVRGPRNLIIEVLSLVSDADDRSFCLQSFLDGSREGSFFLHSPQQSPFGCIAPVRFLWESQPQSETPADSMILLWIHPAVWDDALSALQQSVQLVQAASKEKTSLLQFRSLKDDIVRFEIRGPRAQQVMSAALISSRSSTDSANHQSVSGELWESFSALRCTSSVPANVVLAFNVLNPRVSSPRQPFSAACKPAKIRAASLPQVSPSSHVLLQSSIRRWPSNVASSTVWTASGNHQNEPDPAFVDSSSQSIPVVLIKREERQGAGSGWDLVANRNWGLPLWLALQFSGARAIGLRDRRRFAAELGVPHFPEDFPDTVAGRMHDLFVASSLRAAHLLLPPSKRISTDSSSFSCDWQSLFTGVTSNSEHANAVWVVRNQHFLRIFTNPCGSLAVLNRLAQNSTSADLVLFNSALIRILVRFIAKGKPNERAEILLPSVIDYSSQGAFNNHISRPVIGKLCAGGFSIARGCGFGVGFVSVSQLSTLILQTMRSKSSSLFVLVRDLNSNSLHLASMEILDT